MQQGRWLMPVIPALRQTDWHWDKTAWSSRPAAHSKCQASKGCTAKTLSEEETENAPQMNKRDYNYVLNERSKLHNVQTSLPWSAKTASHKGIVYSTVLTEGLLNLNNCMKLIKVSLTMDTTVPWVLTAGLHHITIIISPAHTASLLNLPYSVCLRYH